MIETGSAPRAGVRRRSPRRRAAVFAISLVAVGTAFATVERWPDGAASDGAASGGTASVVATTQADVARAERLVMLAHPPSLPPPELRVPAPPGDGKRIVVDESDQRTWLWDGPTLVRTYLVSGKVGYPGPGAYRIYSKSPASWLAETGQRFQYMVRFAHGRYLPLGFHSIPVEPDGTPSQTEAQLGQPLSHGCVRQRIEDAEFLYSWAPIGTPVTVKA